VVLFGFIPSSALAQADLTMSVSGVPADEIRGGNFTAQYSVHNQGPDQTSGSVVVTVALDNASIQTLSGGGTGTVNQSDDQNATITYPSFPAGLTITNDVVIVTNGSGGDATVTISVSTGNDSNTANNSFSATVTVPTRPEGDLIGTVYEDANNNGEVDGGDTPIEGVQVGINTGLSRTTNAEGSFEFIDLFRRPYDVTVTLPDGHTLVIPETNPFSVNVEDGGVTTVVILLNDENEPVTGSISGTLDIVRSAEGDLEALVGVRVFDDVNDNGAYDDGEASTTSNVQGYYQFTDLAPGLTFQTRVEMPVWAVPVNPDVPFQPVVVEAGVDTDLDFRFRFSGTIGGFLYLDNDADGMFDDTVDELAVDVLKYLSLVKDPEQFLNATGFSQGEFTYSSLFPGDYNLRWYLEGPWEISQQPPEMVIRETSPFFTDIPFGIYERITIGGRAFLDSNENGVRDDGEPDAPGIQVECSSSGDCQGQAQQTASDGSFYFFDVQPGTFTLTITGPDGTDQILAPSNGQFQFTLKSGEDALELAIAVKDPANAGPSPDMVPSVTAAPDFPAPGDDITYTIVTKNAGTAEALETLTEIQLPEADYVSATTTQGGCVYDVPDDPVRCTHASIAAGDSVVTEVVVRATKPDTLQIMATVSTSTFEPERTNNSQSLDWIVTPVEISASLPVTDHMTCTPEWEPLGGSSITPGARSTTDGNLTRYTVRVVNSHPDREEVVTVDMMVEGSLVGLPVVLVIPPSDSKTTDFSFDTQDKAWTSTGEARTTPYQIQFVVRRGEGQVAEVTEALEVLPRPLVLVHGLWSDATTWDSWESYATSVHPGWAGRVFAVDNMETGVSPKESGTIDAGTFTAQTIEQNAAALESFIAEKRNDSGACHIDVVAHSMGGLISRNFIHDRMAAQEADSRRLFDDLIMLGTPNEGSPCTDQALSIWEYYVADQIRNPPENAEDQITYTPNNLIQLSKPYLSRFNMRVTDKKGVKYHIMAGDYVPRTCRASETGDLFVEVSSALALSNNGLLDGVKDLRVISHISMTGSQEVFSEFVLPILKPETSAPATEEPRVPRLTEVMRTNDISNEEDYVEIFSSNVSVSGEATSFEVGSVDSLSFMIFAPEDASSEVRDSDGTVVWDVQAGSEDADGWFRTATLDGSPAGTWSVVVNGPTGSASFSVHALRPDFDMDAVIGDPVNDVIPISATLTGGGSSIVTAQALIDGKDPVMVALNDSGNSVFEGSLAVGAAGTAAITVEAQLDGQVRRVRDWVDIATVTDVEPSEIPSAFQLTNVYPNPMRGNGMLEVEMPKESNLTIRLFDTLGRQVERIAQTHLTAGVHRVPLQIRAAAGVYLLMVETQTGRSMRRIVVME
jgi:uncharacterized repeat protein (TIGR01451 family)